MCIFCILGIAIFLWLLHIYMTGGVCKIKKNLSGKVVFITGANTGIGKETALQLGTMGATIVIACRDTIKGQAVLDELNKLTKAFMIKLDLSCLNSVKQSVEDFKKLNIPQIDILINNAGVMAPQTYKTTKQSYELQFGTNHLGHFLLTELLVPYLKVAQQSRLVNVASLAHKHSKLDFQDINCSQYANSKLWPIKYNLQAYGNSKLCNILHAMEVSKRHGIKGCSLHPGVVRTELVREIVGNPILNIVFKLVTPIYFIFTKSCLQGAQTTLQCALEDYDKLVDGGYYSDCKIKQPLFANKQLAEKLWEFSTEKLKPYLQK
ncbi:unnamed protein product (macronuclear) [Paramecium tetraurelia]|uniref:Chromosome undetermined scaffold_1, whole genome shotgun sequence n=1 Tax=Paramecium tetraurelia TaxID=5888 RepID=Q6BGC9_PARTE|nr:Retinol dehydogenase [Paramecium tetraurelia strain d4-2]XP_001423411.1 uncharacterized protein GSPATT00000448001 [Paramecium tetraurelia]CAH03291.1 Retinol dehydogenase, putative [Paramecium tetraurelia]CAK56013.1 unnamed protein product [Paramecium tetraurelia]|eukprot:XP_001423411.1 hypothetical protein (macronuclear) [Paramecium tetraurelia strain d4-2]